MANTPPVRSTPNRVDKPGQTPKTQEAQRVAPFRIESAQRRSRYLKLLVYGNFGVGKTTLAATSCDVESMRDVIMINAEGGELSVEEQLNSGQLDAVSVTTFRTLARIKEYLTRHCRARDTNDIDQLKEMEAFLRGVDASEITTPKQYRTVIIDSLTEIEAYCFNQLLGVTDSTKLDDEIQGAEFKEYKQNHGMIMRLVREFRDLPMHVIFVCAEQYAQDETKKMKYSPDLTGKLSKKIQGFMDMIGYYAMGAGEDGKEARRLYVTPSAAGRYDAKHRYQKFKGQYFHNPTIGSILKEVGLHDKEGAAVK